MMGASKNYQQKKYVQWSSYLGSMDKDTEHAYKVRNKSLFTCNQNLELQKFTTSKLIQSTSSN